ncbi:MAG: AroM family protein [Propioniciclava sp.]|uniref:AroM family protein n=1 Tax=Propioniciclava sp. TaxID=2038686 RepID=UPI0039E68892
MSTLAVITIGQAPRVDVTPELAAILGEGVRLVEHGALDPLDAGAIAALAPPAGATEGVLTSRLRDGSHAVFTHAGVEPLLADAIARGEADGADATLIICGSHFPEFPHARPLFTLEPLACAAMRGLLSGFPGRRLGVVAPLAEQVDEAVVRWRDRAGAQVSGTAVASPYTDSVQAIAHAAASLAASSDLVVLDCAGYGREAASAARRACAESGSPVPVVTVRTLGAHVLASLL